MLGISIYNGRVNFIRTSKLRNNDLCVTHHGFYTYSNLNKTISNSIRDIIKKEKITNETSLSLVLDSQFCLFNQVFCEDIDSLNFHDNLSGASAIKHLDSYYYPIGARDDQYLGVHVDKNFKQQVTGAIDKLGLSIKSMGIGIFSAEKLASSLFDAKSLNKYLIVRFVTSSEMEVLYVNDGLFCLYGRYNIVKKGLKEIKAIGSKVDQKDVRLALEQIAKGRKSLSHIDRAFVYQTSGQSKIVKSLINKKYKDVVLMNLFNHKNISSLRQNITTSMSQLTFAELGVLFGSLNV